jgi:hypothetical protein
MVKFAVTGYIMAGSYGRNGIVTRYEFCKAVMGFRVSGLGSIFMWGVAPCGGGDHHEGA